MEYTVVSDPGAPLRASARLFVRIPELIDPLQQGRVLQGFIPASLPANATAWDLQFWRAIFRAEGKCTLLIHMDSVPNLRIPRYKIQIHAT